MKALTVCQPYASLIVSGAKRIENRTWDTRQRGPVLIHAGKSRKWLKTWHGPMPDPMPFGAIIGRVSVVECLRADQIRRGLVPPGFEWVREDPHMAGPYCWILSAPEVLAEPIPYAGMQLFFFVHESTLAGARWLVARESDRKGTQ